MDFQSIIQVASMKQKNVEKKASHNKHKSQEKKPSGNAVKSFLKKQEEEEKRKAEEAKKKKLELLKLRVEANNQRKANAMSNTTKENIKLFDMTDEDQKALQKQASEDFEGLKHTDFVKKVDRTARTPNEAAMAARLKLEQIKNKMKGSKSMTVSDRMAEIDKELSDEEKEEKTNPKKKEPGPPKEEWQPDKHKSSSKHKDKHRHKDRDREKSDRKEKDHKRDRDERHKTSSSKHREKEHHSSSSHRHKDKERESSKDLHKSNGNSSDKTEKGKFSGAKLYVEPEASISSDSDISDISLDEPVKKTKKEPAWVSVKPKSKPLNIPSEEKARPKIKPKAFKNLGPPPMSFLELLQVASKQQKDPNAVKEVAAEPKKKKINDRPLTQEEKEREARRNTKEYQDWIKFGKRPSKLQNKDSRTSSKVEPSPKSHSHRTEPPSKLNGASSSSDKFSSDVKSKHSSSKLSVSQNNGVHHNTSQKRSSSQTDKRDDRIQISQPKKKSRSPSPDESHELMEKLKQHQEMMRKQQEEAAKLMKMIEDQKRKKEKKSESSSTSKSNSSSQPSKSSTGKSSSSLSSLKPGASYKSTSNNKVQKRSKHDMSDDEGPTPPKKKVSLDPPVNPWDRIYGQIQAKRPKVKKKRPEDDFIDDGPLSDEYDSEMDDFIADDDEDDTSTNYSKHIKSIFGYDRRRYKNERDDDLRDMEVGYSTIAKEEARSLRLGMKEDLEDMRKEEEELRRKKAAMKRKR